MPSSIPSVTLASIRFESDSQLSELAKGAFVQSSVTSIHLPASVTIIDEFCFSGCKSLASITFDPASTFWGTTALLLDGMRVGETHLREATSLLDD
jgi:hypothetical protein